MKIYKKLSRRYRRWQGRREVAKHYSQFYDAETQSVIRRLYADDIELFSCEFEDKP
jgi:hypothetical protein